ncbi:UDP-N-acetylglucosamine 2-epimerase [Peribacillus asahii]|uniref:UDP-N-acetylglucosamine 2-epimerase n=1 Tax=Peribacillus asahii TaxID=228899 RepID=UPI0038029D3F
MKKLFIVAYGGGHINIQLEVARQFSNEGWEVVFLSTPNTTSTLKAIGKYRYYTFKDLLEEESRNYGKLLIDEIHNNHLIDYDESLAYGGVNYKNLVEIYGEERANNLYKSFGRRIFLPINSIKKLLDIEKPDLVSVTLSAARAERAAIIAAKERDIKVMAIEDLFGTACAFSIYDNLHVKNSKTKQLLIDKGVPEERINLISTIQNNFQVPSFHTTINEYIGITYKYVPDYIFCINSYAKKQLVERGIPEEVIYEVGQPSLDKIFENYSNLIDIEKEKMILVTTQPLDSCYDFLELINPVLMELSKENYKVIIRYHPSTNGELERQYFGNYSSNIVISRSENLYELLAKVSLLITQTSTTAIESGIFNTKTLSLALGNDNFISFEEAGIAKSLNNPTKKEVYNTVISLLDTNDSHCYNWGLTYCDGRSSKRIYQVIKETKIEKKEKVD